MAELPIDERKAAWKFISIALRVVLAAVFVFAAIMKLADLNAFAREIRQYQVIPDALSVVVANIVPWFELVVSAFLLAGIWRLETRLLFMVMLVGFTAIKVLAELRGLKIECGCFGHDNIVSQVLSGWRGIALNVGLMVLLGLEALGARRLSAARTVGAATDG